MAISKIVTIREFNQMKDHKAYTENRSQQQSMKLQLLKGVEAAYGERYWRLSEGTREVIDTLCGFAAKRGFVFLKGESLADWHGISDKTVRNVLKTLRETGVLFTIYRRSSKMNGRTAPVHLFTAHPYYAYWENTLGLRDFKNEVAEISCKSK